MFVPLNIIIMDYKVISLFFFRNFFYFNPLIFYFSYQYSVQTSLFREDKTPPD